MKKFRVTAKAPTVYQYGSVKYFGTPKENKDGSFTFSQDFDSEEEAKTYLKERASNYFTDSQEELDEAIAHIEDHGSIYMDAVGGGIEEVEED